MGKEVFETELNRFHYETVRRSAETILDFLPDYFYEIPATFNEKHHPAFAHGKGGLVRHTKAACFILEDLMDNATYGVHDDYEKDLMRLAMLIHDGYKAGLENTGHTDKRHPLLMAGALYEHQPEISISRESLERVAGMVRSHMGPFNKDDLKRPILPLPKTNEEIIVHLADYMSAQEYIHFEFDGNEIVDPRKKETSLLLKPGSTNK